MIGHIAWRWRYNEVRERVWMILYTGASAQCTHFSYLPFPKHATYSVTGVVSILFWIAGGWKDMAGMLIFFPFDCLVSILTRTIATTFFRPNKPSVDRGYVTFLATLHHVFRRRILSCCWILSWFWQFCFVLTMAVLCCWRLCHIIQRRKFIIWFL